MNKITCEWEMLSRHGEKFGLFRRQAAEMRLKAFENQFQSDHLIFLVTGSFGDLIPSILLIKEVCNYRGAPCTIVTYETCFGYSKRFSHTSLRFAFVNNNQASSLHYLLIASGRNFFMEKGRLFPTLPTLHPYIAEAILTQRLSEYEGRRLILSLPVGQKFSFLYDTARETSSISQLVKFGVIDITSCVLISPLANTNPSFSPLFVQKLLENLNLKCDVILNLSGASLDTRQQYLTATRSLERVRHIDLPTEEIFEVTKLAKAHIGPANGLTTMLIFFNACPRQIIIREKVLRNPSVTCPTELASIKDTLQGDWNDEACVLELITTSTESVTGSLAEICSCIDRFISQAPFATLQTIDAQEKIGSQY